MKALLEDCSGLLWIGTLGGGLNVTDLKAKPFHRYPVTGQRPGGLTAKDVRSVIADDSGNIWAGTAGEGAQPHRPRHRSHHPATSAASGFASRCR